MGVKCANLRDDAVIGDRCPDCDHAVALHGRDRICDLCTELDPLNRIVALGPIDGRHLLRLPDTGDPESNTAIVKAAMHHFAECARARGDTRDISAIAPLIVFGDADVERRSDVIVVENAVGEVVATYIDEPEVNPAPGPDEAYPDELID